MSKYDITLKEKDAIRFYGGDIRKRELDGQISNVAYTDGYEGIKSAYKTLNCLMFSGISNEIERVKEKKAKLSPLIILEAEKSLEIYCDIYRAMCKYAIAKTDNKSKKVYRTDRGISVEALKKGELISFTSTSQENSPEEFLLAKSDLTLLEIIVPISVPYIDFQEVLGEEYLYSNQKEILLPPFWKISLTEIELSEQERNYKDIEGNPPKAKYLVIVHDCYTYSEQAEPLQGEEDIFSETRKTEAAEILEKLIQGNQLTALEIQTYSKWKQDFRKVIMRRFRSISEDYFNEDEEENTRRNDLMDEIYRMMCSFKKKRQTYKTQLFWLNIMLAVISLLPIACMALSFLPGITTLMKVTAIIASILSILLTRIIKLNAYNTKLFQRTKTYLALCDLYRQIKFEQKCGEDKISMYVQKFRDIMNADTEMSLSSLHNQITNGEELFQNEMDDFFGS